MTTSNAHPIEPFPNDKTSPTDHGIVSVVAMYLALRGKTRTQLANAIGMSSPTMSSRMNHLTSWTAWEVKAIADFLRRPVEDFYADPDELLRSRCFSPSPLLTALPGGDDPDDDDPTIRPRLTLV